MQTPFNLGRLQLLRRAGQAPQLPVFLANSWQFERNLEAAGALVIRVRESDSEQDWQPVTGLDVILSVTHGCAWTPLVKAVRDARPRRLRALVNGELTTMWGVP